MRPVITYTVKDGQVVIVESDAWVLNLGGHRHVVDGRWVGTLDMLNALRAQNRDVVFAEAWEPPERPAGFKDYLLR